MKKIYTCFACGFPIAFEETEVPALAPAAALPVPSSWRNPGAEASIREEST